MEYYLIIMDVTRFNMLLKRVSHATITPQRFTSQIFFEKKYFPPSSDMDTDLVDAFLKHFDDYDNSSEMTNTFGFENQTEMIFQMVELNTLLIL